MGQINDEILLLYVTFWPTIIIDCHTLIIPTNDSKNKRRDEKTTNFRVGVDRCPVVYLTISQHTIITSKKKETEEQDNKQHE
jgi:hypothetical protein